jgi:hypothetical protein
MNDLLQARFEPLRDESQGDWRDVMRRASRRSRRRRLTIAATLVLGAVLVAPAALALRSTVVDFFQSEPASHSLVVDFARMDVGAPPGLENHVLYEQTRKIFERKLESGKTLTLWVAPTKTGGFCEALVGPRGGGGMGCLQKRVPIAPTIAVQGAMSPDGVIRSGPVLVSGSVGMDKAETIELHYQDGDVDRQALTWVSSPIDVGFFLFDVPERHWPKEHRFERLILRDAEGRELYSEAVTLHGPPAMDLKTGAPSDALQEQARKLISVSTHTGAEAALWTAPTADGRTCHWLRSGESGGFGGGCPPKGVERPVLGVGQSQGGGVVLLWGGPARADVAEIEVRYEDGERAVVPVVEGMALYEIPPEHFPRGHRPNLLIARAADGRELARRRQETNAYGAYPCKHPVAIPHGYGETACP